MTCLLLPIPLETARCIPSGKFAKRGNVYYHFVTFNSVLSIKDAFFCAASARACVSATCIACCFEGRVQEALHGARDEAHALRSEVRMLVQVTRGRSLSTNKQATSRSLFLGFVL